MSNLADQYRAGTESAIGRKVHTIDPASMGRRRRQVFGSIGKGGVQADQADGGRLDGIDCQVGRGCRGQQGNAAGADLFRVKPKPVKGGKISLVRSIAENWESLALRGT